MSDMSDLPPKVRDWFKAAGKAAVPDLSPLRSLYEGGHITDVDIRDEHGNTALMWASTNGDTDMVQYLIDKGADVNANNKGGYTVLMYTSALNRPAVVSYLISKGADVHAKTRDGITVIMMAAMNCSFESCRTLVDAGTVVTSETVGEVGIYPESQAKATRAFLQSVLDRAS